jgi:hypothetical protein
VGSGLCGDVRERADIEEGERRMRRGGGEERNREGDQDMLYDNGFEILV